MSSEPRYAGQRQHQDRDEAGCHDRPSPCPGRGLLPSIGACPHCGYSDRREFFAVVRAVPTAPVRIFSARSFCALQSGRVIAERYLSCSSVRCGWLPVSAAIQLRTYRGQLTSRIPEALALARNCTAARSANVTSLRSRVTRVTVSFARSSCSRATCSRSMSPLRANTIACGVDERWIRKVNRAFLLTFTTEQAAGQVQTIGSIEGRVRAREFLTTTRENGSMMRLRRGWRANHRSPVRGDSRSGERPAARSRTSIPTARRR